MYKPIIRKDKDQRGRITLTFNDGQIESHMWFDDESQFQGFVFVLGMMISSGANSFGCIIDTSSEVHLDGQIVEEHDYEEKS